MDEIWTRLGDEWKQFNRVPHTRSTNGERCQAREGRSKAIVSTDLPPSLRFRCAVCLELEMSDKWTDYQDLPMPTAGFVID